MNERERLALRFEEHRPHLRAVAYRMLGSISEADDAVQDTWLRLSRSDPSSIHNLRAWLTTAVARSSLNLLQWRRSHREVGYDTDVRGSSADLPNADPEQAAVVADSVGVALLVVLDMLTPRERVAFVLHDVFAVPFEEIAGVVGRTPAATRKLASRARRRVQAAGPPGPDLARQRAIVTAFLAAAHDGNFDGLLAMLDPNVVVRADAVAVAAGAPRHLRGALSVAEAFSGHTGGALLALVNGVAGAAWAPGGTLAGVFTFTLRAGRIAAISLIAEPQRVAQLDVQFPVD